MEVFVPHILVFSILCHPRIISPSSKKPAASASRSPTTTRQNYCGRTSNKNGKGKVIRGGKGRRFRCGIEVQGRFFFPVLRLYVGAPPQTPLPFPRLKFLRIRSIFMRTQTAMRKGSMSAERSGSCFRPRTHSLAPPSPGCRISNYEDRRIRGARARDCVRVFWDPPCLGRRVCCKNAKLSRSYPARRLHMDWSIFFR